MRRLLVFAPFSGIWPHGLSEAELLDQLDEHEFQITMVNCKGLLAEHCVVMESFRLEHDASETEKQRVCRTCKKCTDALASDFPYERIWLDELSSLEDQSEADRLVADVHHEDYVNLTLDWLEIGRLCSYETLIKYKKTSLALSKPELEYYKKSLRSAVLSFRAVNRLLDQRDFDAVLTYSPQYSSNMMCFEAASHRDVPCYFMEGSSNIHERYTAVRIWSWPHFKMVNPALSYYATDTHNVSRSDERRVASHFREIALGRSYSVYSPTSNRSYDIRRIHSIEPESRVLLAALSSYDEAFSAMVIGGFPKEKFESDIFTTQFDWISALVAWVATRNDLHLIIRLHPRDLPNRRDSVISEQSARWTELLADLPYNVSVDHPEQKIPIASYFSQISAFTTGWSSTGIEAMMHCVPVVTYDERLPSYPREIHLTGRSRETYWVNLDSALKMPHVAAIQEMATQWMSFSLNRGTVRVRGRLFDQRFVQRSRVLYYVIGAMAKMLPELSRRVDMWIGRAYPVRNDARILNRLMKIRASSLYDVLETS